MLKKISKLFLGLVVCAGSACVTPTHASSAAPSPVVLVYIQAASPLSAKEEMVGVYNNSPNEADITGWCLNNKTSVSFACFEDDDAFSYILPAYSYAVAATEYFIVAHTIAPELITVQSTITNQSSGSLVNSNDSVSLTDADGEVVDQYTWTSALPSGKAAIRTKSLTDPRVYETSDLFAQWSVGIISPMPVSQVERRAPTLPEMPAEEPDAPEDPTTPETPTVIHPRITELLPNAVGSDTNGEFIELYNPADEPISLTDYALRVGATLEKRYVFPSMATLPPYHYLSFSNTEMHFTLSNSSSSLQLEYRGELVGERVSYASPKEGYAWALLGAIWQYVRQPSPGYENISELIVSDEFPEHEATVLKPCAPNQYRNLETNRCRLIATIASSITPCKEGQERNPETNRCRNIATASTPTPCKEGQERNPETNRCRNIAKMSEAQHGVQGIAVQDEPVRWYMWIAVAGVVLAVGGYAVWEWRNELMKLGLFIKQKFARTKG